jgi:co-chaperonin GroES (HSP10)
MTNMNLMTSEMLPLEPVGYYLLIEERLAPKKAGLIELPQEAIEAAQYLTQSGKVVAMGDSCYQHESFKGKSWADIGSDVMFFKNSGVRIDMKNDSGEATRYRLMKDNDILAIIHNPERIKGAYV